MSAATCTVVTIPDQSNMNERRHRRKVPAGMLKG